MGTIVSNGVIYSGAGGGGGTNITKLTQAQYNALSTEKKNNGTIYYITDASASELTASNMPYSNTTSGLSSTTVQGAIDEVATNTKTKIDEITDDISNLPAVYDQQGNIDVGEEGMMLSSNGDGTYSWKEAGTASIQINITTTSTSFIGKTVNVYFNSELVKSGVFTSEKLLSFKVKDYGTYRITCDEDETSVLVSAVQLYTVEINESDKAIINITTSTESFYGKTVTMTSASETKSTTFSASGTATMKAKYLETYTISCEGYTNTVTVSSLTATYNTEVHKPVSTITVTTTTEEWFNTQVVFSLGGSTVKDTTFSNTGVATLVTYQTGVYTITSNEKSVEVNVNQLDRNYSASINDTVVYGFHINGSLSYPSDMVSYDVTYDGADVANKGFTPAAMNYSSDIFNYGSWNDAFFMPKPCMLKYDGTVDYFLNPKDYTKKADGTASDVANTSYAGNAMMQWPKIYMKIVADSSDSKSGTVYISDGQLDSGFHCYSNIDCNGNEIDYFYTPIYNGSLVSNKIRSLSGQAIMQKQTATNEVTYAKANNTTSSIDWYTEVYSDRMLINMLLVLISKTVDTQTAFGKGNMSGYNSSDTTNYGMCQPGTMNTKGLFWGKNESSQSDNSGVKVFGMENWWGNQYRRIAGWIKPSGAVQTKVKLTYGTQDGSSTTGYNETGDGYISVGIAPTGTGGGYIKSCTFTPQGLIPTPKSVETGSDSTYYCDYCYIYNNTTVGYAFVGGYCFNGLNGGAFCVDLNSAASRSYWYIGASLSCKPHSVV